MTVTEQRGHYDFRQDDRRLLTTGEAARLLGVSRPTVIAMCESGDIPFVMAGTHRRIEAAIVQALRERPKRRLTASRRSLWLAHATAGQLVQDPERTLALGRSSLQSMIAARPRGLSRQWLARWEKLLDGPLDDILAALTGTTVEHDELRQHSPLTAALTEQQRQAVLTSFRIERDRHKNPGTHRAPASSGSDPNSGSNMLAPDHSTDTGATASAGAVG